MMADTILSPQVSGGSHSALAPPSSVPITTILSDDQSAAVITINPGDGIGEFSIPATAYSLSGFRNWSISDDFPQRGRITFSPDGLIVDMSPEMLETHNYIKADVGWTVHGIIQQRDLGRFFADRVLFSNEHANVSTEPDAMFISGQSVQTGRCMLVPSRRPGVNMEVLGSPDWILEVVSATSVRKDKIILRDAYFHAGVTEYWIIDALHEEIEFQILIPSQGQYQAVESHDGWLASPTFGCSFLLSSKIDKNGFLHYQLQVREKR
jgi:Uma2 family endonuclease